MNLSALDWILVVAASLGNTALFTVLIIRHRWKGFPVFTALMGFETALSPVQYAIFAHGSVSWYARFYWSSVLIEFLLQLGVIWEIARIVMQPTGTWLRDAKKQFILGGAAGVLLAVALSWMISPPASTLLDRLNVRSSFFTSLVVCELFVVMLLTAKRLGLGLRNHVFALVTGWSVWVIAAMLVDLLHGYYGTHLHYDALDNLRKFAYLAALVYWMVQFWLDEPARQEIPPELRAYILALHQRVNKDIDTLGIQR
jgi:hypothetical protein